MLCFRLHVDLGICTLLYLDPSVSTSCMSDLEVHAIFEHCKEVLSFSESGIHLCLLVYTTFPRSYSDIMYHMMRSSHNIASLIFLHSRQMN